MTRKYGKTGTSRLFVFVVDDSYSLYDFAMVTNGVRFMGKTMTAIGI